MRALASCRRYLNPSQTAAVDCLHHQSRGLGLFDELANVGKTPAKAEPVVKVLFENAKVKVTESRFPPGSVSPSSLRPGRVVHTVQGGTLERTLPDGKKVKVETKTGDTRWLDAETCAVTNVGKSEVVLHVVYLK